MSLPALDPDAPDFTRRYVNLADALLGAVALDRSDDFFAESQRMLNPEPAVFIPGKYDTHGKWMDGWESRRKRVAGHDWCVVRLARPGRVIGVDLDTSHFTGNFPPAAGIEGCFLDYGVPDEHTNWCSLLPAVSLGANRHHYHTISVTDTVSHLRINLYPDGGLARLRVHGLPLFDPNDQDEDGLVDLIAALNGGSVIAANNQHFGLAANLLRPGRGTHMGDGWETRRRREPGYDWCVLALAAPGVIDAIEVDTAHFKGNYPARCSIHAAFVQGGTTESLITQSMFWRPLLPKQSLQRDHQHHFRDEILPHTPISHIRFNIHPDGGVSRLRLRGRPA